MTYGFTFEEIDGASPNEIAAKRSWLRQQKLEPATLRLYTKDGKPRREFVEDRPDPWPFGD
jgi:hypothetical protein